MLRALTHPWRPSGDPQICSCSDSAPESTPEFDISDPEVVRMLEENPALTFLFRARIARFCSFFIGMACSPGRIPGSGLRHRDGALGPSPGRPIRWQASKCIRFWRAAPL